MKTAAFSCLCALGVFIAAQPAEAILISVDRATFQASIGEPGISLQDFDSIAPGTVLFDDGDITYLPGGGAGFVTADFTTSTPSNSLGSISTGSFIAGSGAENLDLIFANPITAFAIDIITSAVSDGAYRVDIGADDADSIFQVFPSGPSGQFIGFTSDTPFSALTITAVSGFDYTVDTLIYGDASALDSGGPGGPTDVPEPGVLLLLSGGLIGIALLQRRRQRRTIDA